MYKKLIPFILFISFFQMLNAQNEFITIWKPGPTQQIKFPGRGNNFQVSWEEIGYPQHNGNLSNVTSTIEFNLDFGAPLNPVPSNATYRVKISNGNGTFNQVRFFDNTLIPIYNGADRSKILEVAQWGNIQWQTFDNAFVYCNNLDVTATDEPNLTSVTSMSEMFYLCLELTGNSSFNKWNTSSVTNMYYMFGDAYKFDAPIGNWNVSNVTHMDYMFDAANKFNQPLTNWNTSKVITMKHMFHEAYLFNQNISNWNTSNVTDMEEMFHDAYHFNQNIGNWNLTSLVAANNIFLNSGLNCQNYDNILYGWNLNPLTPSNINISSASPLIYSHNLAVSARNSLINRGWNISGDSYNGQCASILSTTETITNTNISIYPNPVSDFVYIKNIKGSTNYKIFDTSERIILQGVLNEDKINVSPLIKGNYILQIHLNEKVQSLKFIKN